MPAAAHLDRDRRPAEVTPADLRAARQHGFVLIAR